MPFCHRYQPQQPAVVAHLPAALPQTLTPDPSGLSETVGPGVKGHGNARLFIGPLRASVKVRAHKAAGRSHKHINTRPPTIHRTLLELDRLW